MNVSSDHPAPFPDLPILNPGLPARSQREKYGSLFFLGIAGLLLLIALIAWLRMASGATETFGLMSTSCMIRAVGS